MHDFNPINNTERLHKLSIKTDGIKCLCPPPNNNTVIIVPPLLEMEFVSPKIADENYKKYLEEIQSVEKIKKQQLENKKIIDTDEDIINSDYLSDRNFIFETQAVSMGNVSDIDKYSNSNLLIKFFRERIEAFLRANTDFKIENENKGLARFILSLIANAPSLEEALARICLYGTGLYGEKQGDVISEDLQRQLVGDLLSKLLYGLSVDDYLLNFFSRQRYISIEDFISAIIQDNSPFDGDEMISEMAFFHERYYSHLLPMVSLRLYSSIAVGSVTWVLLYLSANIKHCHHLNEENKYLTNGINVITSFTGGNLSQGSKEKIHLGLKFFAIYSEGIVDPEVLNDFILLWHKFTAALIKRIDSSSNMVLRIKTIRDNLTKIDGIPWQSQFGVATQLMRQHCGPGIPLAFHKINDYFQFVTRKDYINITGNKAWCIVNKYSETNSFISQLPIFKDYYSELLSDALKSVDEANRYLLQELFSPSDFFNVDLEIDDISFINKSALEVVLMRVVEPRYIQEQRIGPVLNKIKLNRRYIFFRATFQSTQRFYAIDTEFQNLLMHIKIDINNLKKSVGIYFDGWSRFSDKNLKLVIYKDSDMNITTSEFESTEVFINKIATYQYDFLRNSIQILNHEFMTVEDKTIEIMKELFIPFYSCISELEKRESSSDIFINCFMDLALVFMPVFGKSFNAARRLSDVSVDLSFRVVASKVFKIDNTILWGDILRDPYIHNAILNEQSILKNSVTGMVLGGIDPGIGTFTELKKIVSYFVSVALKGELIKLPFTMLRNFKVITDFGVRTKNIVDSSRRIFVKASKPSGRLTDLGQDESGGGYSGIFDVIYHDNDYYAVFSDKKNVSVLFGIIDEVTKNGENIYIMLGDEEFKGYFFKYQVSHVNSHVNNFIPYLPNLPAVMTLSPFNKLLKSNDSRVIFSSNSGRTFHSLIYYPFTQCLFSEDGFMKSKSFDIFKINDSHYIYIPVSQTLRPIYDGDEVSIIQGVARRSHYKLSQNINGELVIMKMLSPDGFSLTIASRYSLATNSTLLNEPIMKIRPMLIFLDGRLLLNSNELLHELFPVTIKNQFMIKNEHPRLPSAIISWYSDEQQFLPTKPYLKKSSSHIGVTLEERVNKKCIFGEKLNKFPTLLVSGAIYSNFAVKVKISGLYYTLGTAINDLYPLACNNHSSNAYLQVSYDLFTESFELSRSDNLSPFNDLLSNHFPMDKFPDLMELVDMNHEEYNDVLTIRLRQAAFLKRLNSVDRTDTLELPLVQIFSWKLHHETYSFQKKYPAIALWMTWQRQLEYFFIKKSYDIHLAQKRELKKIFNNKSFLYDSGILINDNLIEHEAIWFSCDESEPALIFSYTNNSFNSETLDNSNDNGMITWLPKFKHLTLLPVSQFMYEKNIHPLVIKNKKDKYLMLQKFYGMNTDPRFIADDINVEHLFFSPNGQFLAMIDRSHSVVVFLLYETKSEPPYYNDLMRAVNVSILKNCAAINLNSLLLTNKGDIFCQRNGMWVENNGDQYLWVPPIIFNSSFISLDQRFLGFKHQYNYDVILYDDQRKLPRLLKRPIINQSDGYITAVSFSALNAMVAIAFDDGHIYLYDLIRESQYYELNPVAHVKINNIIHDVSYNNILMRFDGVFESLIVIHPEDAGDSSQEEGIVYVRSRYDF